MAISFSRKRIAVNHSALDSKYAKRFIALAFMCLSLISEQAHCQSLIEQMKAPWSLLIFVSSAMPKQQVIALAEQAKKSRGSLILSGFPKWDPTPNGARAWITEINNACCKGKGPGWTVDPKMFKGFKVKVVPAFILSKGVEPTENGFSKVSGDMDVGNALKFFYQESTIAPLRQEASRRYTTAFAGY